MVFIQNVTVEWERASKVVTQRNVEGGLKTVLFQKQDNTEANPDREGKVLHTEFFRNLLREVSNCTEIHFTSSIIYSLNKGLDASKTSITFTCEHLIKNRITFPKISMNIPLKFTVMWHCRNCYKRKRLSKRKSIKNKGKAKKISKKKLRKYLKAIIASLASDSSGSDSSSLTSEDESSDQERPGISTQAIRRDVKAAKKAKRVGTSETFSPPLVIDKEQKTEHSEVDEKPSFFPIIVKTEQTCQQYYNKSK